MIGAGTVNPYLKIRHIPLNNCRRSDQVCLPFQRVNKTHGRNSRSGLWARCTRLEFLWVHAVEDDADALRICGKFSLPPCIVCTDWRNLVRRLIAEDRNCTAQTIQKPPDKERFHLCPKIKILLTEVDAMFREQIRCSSN